MNSEEYDQGMMLLPAPNLSTRPIKLKLSFPAWQLVRRYHYGEDPRHDVGVGGTRPDIAVTSNLFNRIRTGFFGEVGSF
jgi:hypothetical protein